MRQAPLGSGADLSSGDSNALALKGMTDVVATAAAARQAAQLALDAALREQQRLRLASAPVVAAVRAGFHSALRVASGAVQFGAAGFVFSLLPDTVVLLDTGSETTTSLSRDASFRIESCPPDFLGEVGDTVDPAQLAVKGKGVGLRTAGGCTGPGEVLVLDVLLYGHSLGTFMGDACGPLRVPGVVLQLLPPMGSGGTVVLGMNILASNSAPYSISLQPEETAFALRMPDGSLLHLPTLPGFSREAGPPLECLTEDQVIARLSPTKPSSLRLSQPTALPLLAMLRMETVPVGRRDALLPLFEFLEGEAELGGFSDLWGLAMRSLLHALQPEPCDNTASASPSSGVAICLSSQLPASKYRQVRAAVEDMVEHLQTSRAAEPEEEAEEEPGTDPDSGTGSDSGSDSGTESEVGARAPPLVAAITGVPAQLELPAEAALPPQPAPSASVVLASPTLSSPAALPAALSHAAVQQPWDTPGTHLVVTRTVWDLSMRQRHGNAAFFSQWRASQPRRGPLAHQPAVGGEGMRLARLAQNLSLGTGPSSLPTSPPAPAAAAAARHAKLAIPDWNFLYCCRGFLVPGPPRRGSLQPVAQLRLECLRPLLGENKLAAASCSLWQLSQPLEQCLPKCAFALVAALHFYSEFGCYPAEPTNDGYPTIANFGNSLNPAFLVLGTACTLIWGGI
jgi:hypothetical protein